MKKFIIRGAGAVGMAAVSLALLGTGVAGAADNNYVGETYATVTSQLSAQGETAVIASRVGGSLPDSECVVTRWQNTPFGPKQPSPIRGTVQLYLNCSAELTSAT